MYLKRPTSVPAVWDDARHRLLPKLVYQTPRCGEMVYIVCYSNSESPDWSLSATMMSNREGFPSSGATQPLFARPRSNIATSIVFLVERLRYRLRVDWCLFYSASASIPCLGSHVLENEQNIEVCSYASKHSTRGRSPVNI